MTSLLMRLKNGLNYKPHHMTPNFFPLLFGWFLDKCLGDPSNLPHPVVWFGRWIALNLKEPSVPCSVLLWFMS